MNNANGSVFKYPDNVDTDVIIPARHLNTQDAKELASHCMEDIDKDFVNRVQPGDIMVGGCRCSLVVVGELEGGEGAPQETVAHA